jgi:hypothetical protein
MQAGMRLCGIPAIPTRKTGFRSAILSAVPRCLAGIHRFKTAIGHSVIPGIIARTALASKSGETKTIEPEIRNKNTVSSAGRRADGFVSHDALQAWLI